MIKERYIKEWSADHPWKHSEQVEGKLQMPEFLSDAENYLGPSVRFDPLDAWRTLKMAVESELV